MNRQYYSMRRLYTVPVSTVNLCGGCDSLSAVTVKVHEKSTLKVLNNQLSISWHSLEPWEVKGWDGRWTQATEY
jgi:hypothetical protein